MEAVVAVLILAGLLGALTPIARAGWRRLTSREGELQIWRTMPRIGVAPEDAARPDPEMARAVRRCLMCPSIEKCEGWLASGERDGLDAFCPNASFFAELKATKGPSRR